jgi:hypothetical protein
VNRSHRWSQRDAASRRLRVPVRARTCTDTEERCSDESESVPHR